MRVVGEWFLCDDGTTRPVIQAGVQGSAGRMCLERFLVDLGADRTVFSAGLLYDLQALVNHHPPGMTLEGISGSAPFVLLTSVIEFTRDDGGPARVRGEFAAFTDRRSAEMSVLGRDVLNNFDVIVSRPRNEILLLAPNTTTRSFRGRNRMSRPREPSGTSAARLARPTSFVGRGSLLGNAACGRNEESA